MTINLTPHAITVVGCTPPVSDPPAAWTLAPSGQFARATERVTPAEPIDGIPTTTIEYTGIVGASPRSVFDGHADRSAP